jgi:catechol 2,3-dioxygenase-like lactoylglutathione lyase family enzyme
MKILRLDHIVLTVRDVNITSEFYNNVLGMEIVTFEDNRKALLFGEQKINLHKFGKELEPRAQYPTPGSADLCFITKKSVEELKMEIESKGIKIIEGPVKRIGAIGMINSIYLMDPDNNLIELSNYIEHGINRE